jgi:hypothetical protein
MPSQNEFPSVFDKMKAILKPYAPTFTVKADTGDSYYLEGKYSETYKNNLFFASTQIKKNYVSFYLMPVYMYPDLLKGISPELKKHMQGKSCFNFKKVEPGLLDELKALTQKGYDRLMKEEYS